jgi:O-antigen ligase
MSEQSIPIIDNVLLEYLKLLRGEIHLRIEKHYKLSLFKLLALGAIISFGIINSESINDFTNQVFYSCLIAFIAICFDFQMAMNLRWMNTTGTFIRDHIEKHFQDTYKIKLYETGALGVDASLNKIVEIGITFVACLYGILRLPKDQMTANSYAALIIIIIIFWVLSSLTLYKSQRGFAFD